MAPRARGARACARSCAAAAAGALLALGPALARDQPGGAPANPAFLRAPRCPAAPAAPYGRGSLRAALLPGLAAAAAAPARGEGTQEARRALYQGKAKSIRAGAEWWRFFVGDLIDRGTGSADSADGLAAGDADCGGGLCAAATSLQRARKLLIAGPSRGGQASLSQVERILITPMYTMADLGLIDPDTVDDLSVEVANLSNTLSELGKTIKTTPGDAGTIAALYVTSLRQMNKYAAIANEAYGAANTDDWFLPQLPLSQEALRQDPYWQQQRSAYDEASDPVKQFKERQALGSKDLRDGLKRFPGATLLLR